MNEAREKLGTMAEEINVRLGKAEGYDGRAETAMHKADDHRLAAALKLAEARTLADDHRIGWKRWVDKNIARSYRDVKRLVAIGSSKDPVLALEGARERGRDARARSRGREAGETGDSAPGRPAGQQSASDDESAQSALQIDASVISPGIISLAKIIDLADPPVPGTRSGTGLTLDQEPPVRRGAAQAGQGAKCDGRTGE